MILLLYFCWACLRSFRYSFINSDEVMNRSGFSLGGSRVEPVLGPSLNGVISMGGGGAGAGEVTGAAPPHATANSTNATSKIAAAQRGCMAVPRRGHKG